MSQLTTFNWNKARILWFLDFLNSVLDSMTGWSARYASKEVHNSLLQVQDQVNDTKNRIEKINGDPTQD